MIMKRQAKWFLIPCAAMALTMGSALVSFAATGWAEENGEWVYYNNAVSYTHLTLPTN